MSKNSFVLSYDFREVFKNLSTENKAILIDAIFDYEITGEYQELDGLMKVIFIPVRKYLDRNKERYSDKCQKNKQNAEKRWTEHATASERIKENANHADNDNDIDNDIDNLYIYDTKDRSTQKALFKANAAFDDLWSKIPKRDGTNNKRLTCRLVNARIKEGHTIAELESGLASYKAFCERAEIINTRMVMTMSRFFGKDKYFLPENKWEEQGYGDRTKKWNKAEVQSHLRERAVDIVKQEKNNAEAFLSDD